MSHDDEDDHVIRILQPEDVPFGSRKNFEHFRNHPGLVRLKELVQSNAALYQHFDQQGLGAEKTELVNRIIGSVGGRFCYGEDLHGPWLNALLIRKLRKKARAKVTRLLKDCTTTNLHGEETRTQIRVVQQASETDDDRTLMGASTHADAGTSSSSASTSSRSRASSFDSTTSSTSTSSTISYSTFTGSSTYSSIQSSPTLRSSAASSPVVPGSNVLIAASAMVSMTLGNRSNQEQEQQQQPSPMLESPTTGVAQMSREGARLPRQQQVYGHNHSLPPPPSLDIPLERPPPKVQRLDHSIIHGSRRRMVFLPLPRRSTTTHTDQDIRCSDAEYLEAALQSLNREEQDDDTIHHQES